MLSQIFGIVQECKEFFYSRLQSNRPLAWFFGPVNIYVVGQFYPWFKFYILLFLGNVMYDGEF